MSLPQYWSGQPLIDGGGQVYNIRSLGCAVDGVTDDTAAFRTALATIAAAKGTTYIPVGTMLLSSGIVMPLQSMRIIGAGKGLTVIKAAPSSSIDKMLTFGDGSTLSLWNQISDLTIDGNGIANYGLFLRNKGFIRGTIERACVQNCLGTPGYGIACENASANNYSMVLQNIEVTNNNIGLYLVGFIQDGKIIAGKIFNNLSTNIQLGEGTTLIADFAITHTQIETDNVTGTHTNLLVNACGCLKLEAIYSESHGNAASHCIEVASNVLAAMFTQLDIDSWYGDGNNTSNNWLVLPNDATRVWVKGKNLYLRRYAQEWIANPTAPNKHIWIEPSESVSMSALNHESQVFSTPFGGHGSGTNYCKQSQALDQSPWTAASSGGGTNPTISTGKAAPDGSTSAAQITFGTAVSNYHNGTTLNNMAGVSLTFSIWLRADAGQGGPVVLRLYSATNQTGQARTVQVGTTWQRYWVTFQPAGGDNSFINVQLENQAGGVANATAVYAWGAQLEQAVAPGPYVPTTTSTQTGPVLPVRCPGGTIRLGQSGDGSTLDVQVHQSLTGGTPTIAAGAGAGTSPTVSLVSGSTDQSGTVTVVTGTTPSASSTVATVTFGVAFGSSPRSVTLTPVNSAAAVLTGNTRVWADRGTLSTTSFQMQIGSSALTATTTYQWSYHVDA